jgi:hypothetical protein
MGRQRVDLGRHGAEVLGWLARGVSQGYAFDPASAEGQRLMGAAEGWLMAWAALNHDEHRVAATA